MQTCCLPLELSLLQLSATFVPEIARDVRDQNKHFSFSITSLLKAQILKAMPIRALARIDLLTLRFITTHNFQNFHTTSSRQRTLFITKSQYNSSTHYTNIRWLITVQIFDSYWHGDPQFEFRTLFRRHGCSREYDSEIMPARNENVVYIGK